MTNKARTTNGGKESLFNKWCWGRWTVTCKRIKLGYSLITYKKINSIWSKGLNVEPETIKFLEENIVHFLTLVLVISFFDTSSHVKEIKSKINKCGNIKLKGFCTLREILTSVLVNYFFVALLKQRK